MSQPAQRTQHIAIIGAGISGLAAAIRLLKNGHRVTIYESAPHAGGRARSVVLTKAVVDNGQHLCLGAYHQTLNLLQETGINIAQVFTRLPLALHMHDGEHRVSIQTSKVLPAPLHLLSALLTAQGLTWQDKWSAICWILRLKRKQFYLAKDESLSTYLEAEKQTATMIRMVWEPLCLAALNTPLQQASAQVFLNVLQDSFLHGRSDSDFLIAKQDLSAIFISPLVDAVHQLGGKLLLKTSVTGVSASTHSLLVQTAEHAECFDRVITAVGPHQRKKLHMPDLKTPVYEYQPITTLYLQFSESIRLPYPVLGLCHGWAQWVFDRGQCCQQPGLIAIVISAHQSLPIEKTLLIEACINEINLSLRQYHLQLPQQPLWSQVITEKRATFSCEPNLKRPIGRTAHMHIFLAGDDIENGYPATIEGAVRNGFRAADYCIESCNTTL